MTQQNEMAVTSVQDAQQEGLICPFSNIRSFQNAWQMARCLSMSSIVPAAFRGPEGQANAMIALELASRLQTSVFMVMQHLYIIQGRPAFSSQFIIAAIQTCGRYSALKYKKRYDSNGKIIACRAYATELSSGDVLEGPEVTMEMVEKEGWLNKNGSKWKTMPEVMMGYRAAAFFGRQYAPDVMMGFRSDDELIENGQLGESLPLPQKQSKTDELNALLDKPEEVKDEEPELEEVKTETPPEEKPQPVSARKRMSAPVETAETSKKEPAPAPAKTTMERVAELKAQYGITEADLMPHNEEMTKK